MKTKEEIKETLERLQSQTGVALTLLDHIVDDPGCAKRHGLGPHEFEVGDFIVRERNLEIRMDETA